MASTKMNPARKTQTAAGAALVIILLVLFTSQFAHCDPSGTTRTPGGRVGNYPYVKPTPLPWNPPVTLKTSTTPAPDRMIVFVSTGIGSPEWLAKDLQQWNSTVYSVDHSFTQLHLAGQKIDKGRIANAYLTYLVENYNNLPEVVVFVDGCSSQYVSKTAPDYNRMEMIRQLNISSIQKTGFDNLRCLSRIGCQSEILPLRKPKDEFNTPEVAMHDAWKELFQDAMMPRSLATPRGAEFAVTRTKVQKRGLNDYRRFWEWLNKTRLDDDTAGIIMEHLWHIIFGRGAQYCSEMERCR